MDIRKTVIERMSALNLTAYSLAKKSKVPQQTVYDFVTSKSPINSNHLGKILAALDLELIGGKELKEIESTLKREVTNAKKLAADLKELCERFVPPPPVAAVDVFDVFSPRPSIAKIRASTMYITQLKKVREAHLSALKRIDDLISSHTAKR